MTRGTETNQLWSAPGNWSGGLPVAAEIAQFNGGAIKCIIDIDDTGALLNATANSNFTPKAGGTFPNIIKSGASTITLAANLNCLVLTVTQGTFTITGGNPPNSDGGMYLPCR